MSEEYVPTPDRATIARAASARDSALALVARVNRWLVAGAVALTGLVSLVASQTFHGRSRAASGAAQSSQATPAAPSPDSSGQPLAAPQEVPAPAPVSPGVVVSGGS